MIALSIALLVLWDSTWQSTLYMAVKAGVIGRGGAVVIIAINFPLVLLILGPGVVVLIGPIVTKIIVDLILFHPLAIISRFRKNLRVLGRNRIS